jgi:CBS domain-containing protein
MTPVYDLVKDRKVYSIDADNTVLEAARFMKERGFGALPVLRDGELVGILSERDIMNRVVAAGRTPGTTRISEVMTPKPKTVGSEETIADCLFPIRKKRPNASAFCRPGKRAYRCRNWQSGRATRYFLTTRAIFTLSAGATR